MNEATKSCRRSLISMPAAQKIEDSRGTLLRVSFSHKVIASLVGTKAVLDPEDARLVAGFIVNRMRGDISHEELLACARKRGR